MVVILRPWLKVWVRVAADQRSSDRLPHMHWNLYSQCLRESTLVTIPDGCADSPTSPNCSICLPHVPKSAALVGHRDSTYSNDARIQTLEAEVHHLQSRLIAVRQQRAQLTKTRCPPADWCAAYYADDIAVAPRTRRSKDQRRARWLLWSALRGQEVRSGWDTASAWSLVAVLGLLGPGGELSDGRQGWSNGQFCWKEGLRILWGQDHTQLHAFVRDTE